MIFNLLEESPTPVLEWRTDPPPHTGWWLTDERTTGSRSPHAYTQWQTDKLYRHWNANLQRWSVSYTTPCAVGTFRIRVDRNSHPHPLDFVRWMEEELHESGAESRE